MISSFLKSPVLHCLLVLSSTILILDHNYPNIGTDYGYYIPRLLDSHLYYLKNGLEIQWWTPFFGGGLPSYPNPQQIQFSVPQFLLFLMDPWMAMIATVAIFAGIGFVTTYCIFSRFAGMRSELATLGAVLFCSSAFFLNHLTAGQLGYHGFPLWPLILLILFQDKMSTITSSLCLGLVLAYLVHSGGFYLILIFALGSLLSILLIDVLIDSDRIRFDRLAKIVAGALVTAVLVAGSKVAATLSLMAHFPRILSDVYAVGFMKGIVGLGMQLFFVPAANLIVETPLNSIAVRIAGGADHPLSDTNDVLREFSGSPYGLWENDIGLSPVALIIFFVFALKARGLITFDRKYLRRKKYSLASAAVAGWLALELTVAKGVIYPFVNGLPVLESLHVNTRFASIFLFPLVLLAVVSFRMLEEPRRSATKPLLDPAVLLSFAAIGVYLLYLNVPAKHGFVEFNVETSIGAWHEMNRCGDDMRVHEIALISDSDAFTRRSSSVRPYEPLFGYHLEEFRSQATIGPVAEVKHDRYFNLTHPASLVFPESNGLRPFELISRFDGENFSRFVEHRSTTWIVPRKQIFFDYVSTYSLAAAAVFLVLRFGFFLRDTKARRQHPVY